MLQKYCTFWYPTIYHKELRRVINEDTLPFKDISDREDASHSKYEINIQLQNENLIITSKVKDASFVVELIHTEEKKNGFVQYRYSTENIPYNHLNEFETVLKKDIYHYAKEFYHKHDVDSGKDSALRAIITDNQESIGTADNQFLLSLLENFTSVFEKHARHLKERNSIVQKTELELDKADMAIKQGNNNPEDIKVYNDVMHNVLSESRELNKICENASIEYAYCKTLLSSRYNLSFQPTVTYPEVDVRDNYRIQALNIENSMRYIDIIKFKNQNRLNKISQICLNLLQDNTERIKDSTISINKVLNQNKKTEKINSLLAWLSIFLALFFGIVYFLDVTCRVCFIVWGLLFFVGIASFGIKLFLLYRKSTK